MWSCLVIVMLLILMSVNDSRAATFSQPDRNPPEFPGILSVRELMALGGYSTTNYEVITEDGYSLWLFRLSNNTGPPVLMQHGVLLAADQWIIRGPGRDLAFLLLERGFDVWLSSQRGTVFNEYSLNYTKSDPRFWDFSFNEMGYYDMPAHIDTVLELTKQSQLFYIGHSLGTTVFFVLCSTRPEYNDKIRAAVLLSPIGYVVPPEEQTGAVRLGQENLFFLYTGLRVAGYYEFIPRTQTSIALLKGLCTGAAPTRNLCLDFFGLSSGENRLNLDPKEFDLFIGYYLAGTSLRTLYHAGQQHQTGEFRQFDFGPIENLRRYGSVSPPSYRLRLVRAPVALFWGYNDVLTSESSVNKIASELPNLIIKRAVPDPKFTHIDMYLGDNANRVLYPEIIALLEKFLKHGELPLYNKGRFHSNTKEESFSHSQGDPYRNTKEGSYPHEEESYLNTKGTNRPFTKPYRDSEEDTYRNTKEELYPRKDKTYTDAKGVIHLIDEEKSFIHSYVKDSPRPFSKDVPYRDTKEESFIHSYVKDSPRPFSKDVPYRDTKEESFIHSYVKDSPRPFSKDVPYRDTKEESFIHSYVKDSPRPFSKDVPYRDTKEESFIHSYVKDSPRPFSKDVPYRDTKEESFIHSYVKDSPRPFSKDVPYRDTKEESFIHSYVKDSPRPFSKDVPYRDTKEESNLHKEETYSSTKDTSYRDTKEESFSHTKEDPYRNTKEESNLHKEESYSNIKDTSLPFSKEQLYKGAEENTYRNKKEEPNSHREDPHSERESHLFVREESHRNTEEQTKEESHPYRNGERFSNSERSSYSVIKDEQFRDSKEVS